MNVYKDKTLLIAGNTENVWREVVQGALKNGAEEIRVFDNNEERLVAMRDELQAHNIEAAAKVKFYCADMNDSESVDDAMPGVDLVLCIPSLKAVTDIESNPADACRNLLDSVDNVMQSAINRGVEKLVVLSPAHNEPLYKTPDLLAALLEKVVVAQGRYQKKGAKTTVCCARIDNDVIGMVDYSFTHAKNADLVVNHSGSYQCQPCYNPDFDRDDFTNL